MQLDEKKTVGEAIGFQRIRRVTGYLVGDLDRFNNAKRSEERERLAHATEHEMERQ
jgi:hypothetical protein